MLSFSKYLESKINKGEVLKAAMEAAAKIHGEPDEEMVKDIVDSAVSKDGVKDTEDAIQVAIDMMRSKK